MNPLFVRRRAVKRFSWGTAPEDVIRSQVTIICPAGLPVALNREDTRTILDESRALIAGRGSYTVGGKWKTTLTADEIVQLSGDLLAAAERDFARGDEESNAASVRSSLLAAIEIEEI